MLHLRGASLSTIFLLCIVFTTHAQHCSLQFKGIVEEENGAPLVGATIYFETLQRGATTDLHGNFSLNDLCPGTIQLVVKYVGYEDQHLTIKIPLTKSLVIRLTPSVNILHDAVVEDRHASHHSHAQSLSLLSKDQLISSRGKPL